MSRRRTDISRGCSDISRGRPNISRRRPGGSNPDPDSVHRPDPVCAPSAAFTLLVLLVLVGPAWAERGLAESAGAETARIERPLETARAARTAVRQIAVHGVLRSAPSHGPRRGAEPVRPPGLRKHGLPRPRAPDRR